MKTKTKARSSFLSGFLVLLSLNLVLSQSVLAVSDQSTRLPKMKGTANEDIDLNPPDVAINDPNFSKAPADSATPKVPSTVGTVPVGTVINAPQPAAPQPGAPQPVTKPSSPAEASKPATPGATTPPPPLGSPLPSTVPAVPGTPPTTPPAVSTPTAAVVTPPATPAAVLGRLDKSMVPGISCPLVDNQPNKDLLDAAENLSKNIASFKTSCSNDTSTNIAEVDVIQNNLTAIKDASLKLKGFADQPELFTSNPAKMVEVQAGVVVLIKGINSVANVLSKNSLLNNNCAKNMNKTTDLIMGFADLVQAAAPIAANILAAFPEFAPAIPFVVGVSAAGNVAKVIGQLNAQNSLNTDDPKVRQAILQNICEYTRIVQRVNSLHAARLGNLKDATSHLAPISEFNHRISEGVSANVLQSMYLGQQIQYDLNSVRKTVAADATTIVYLKDSVSTSDDSETTCSVMKEHLNELNPTLGSIEYLNRSLNGGRIPQAALKLTLNGLLAKEASLRAKILSSDSSKAEVCTKATWAYFDVLEKITQNTSALALRTQDSLDQKLQSLGSVDDKEFIQNQISIQKETARRATLIASVGTINDAEIDTDLREIKLALFGAPPAKRFTFGLLGGESPVLSWYKKVDNQVRLFQADFTREMQALRSEAIAYFPPAYPMPDPWTLAKVGIISAIGDPHANDYAIQMQKGVATLSPLNLQLLPEGTSEHLSMCKRLQNVLNNWQSTLDNLSSLIQYCGYLRDYLDQVADPAIVKACVGKTDWTRRKVYVNSDLNVLTSKLGTLSGPDAKLVFSKYSDLKCATAQ